MQKGITITNHKKQQASDRVYWQAQSPEFRLDVLEKLRLEAGKFLYAYPGRLQRVIKVTGKQQR